MPYIPWWQRLSPPTFAERFNLGGLAGRVGFKGGTKNRPKISGVDFKKIISDSFEKISNQKGKVSSADIVRDTRYSTPTVLKYLSESQSAKLIAQPTPLTDRITKEVNQIIDDVVKNKKPLIDASPNRIYTEVTGKAPKNVKIIQNILEENPNWPKIRNAVTNTSTRVASGNKLFENVKFKDFNKLLKKSLRDRGLTRVSGNIVEQNILRDLIRHIRGGGTQFAFATGSTFDQGWKGLKIKDLAKGDILTQDKIRKLLEQGDSRFTEYLKKFKSMKKLKLHPYIDPITKEKTTLMQGLKKATNIDAPLHIQHNKGVVKSPLKNLSIQTHKANIGAKMVKTAEEAATLGVQTTLPGGKKVVGPKISFEGNVDRLTKFADRKILQTEASGFVKSKTPTQTLTKKGLTSLIGKRGAAKLLYPAMVANELLFGRKFDEVYGFPLTVSRDVEQINELADMAKEKFNYFDGGIVSLKR